MIEVEQRALSALEENALPGRSARSTRSDVSATYGPSRSAYPSWACDDLLDIERLEAVDALEPHVLLRDRQLELLAQDLRVEQVLDADPDARGLVRVGGTDPAPRRADLEATEPPLARAVERDVPGHDEVGVPGHEEESLRRVTARLELVELADQDRRVDDAPRPDRALLAGDDPTRNLADLVRLVLDHDRVAGIRAALVAADEVGLLGQEVDDLSLAFVAPLRPDDDGRGHVPECCMRERGAPRLGHARREYIADYIPRPMGVPRTRE